jgi:hypothetical protein
MEGTCKQNRYRKNLEANFMMSFKGSKINWMSNEVIGGYEAATGHLD